MALKLKYCFFLFPLFFLCCKKESGEIPFLEKKLPYFDHIELKGVFEVYLKQDSVFSIRIEGNEKWVKQIVLTNENNKLIIRHEAKAKWLKPKEDKIKLYISSDRPKQVIASESCYIETVNPIISDEFGIILASKLNQANLELDCKTFYYWNNHPCGGKLTLRGKTEELKLWNCAIMSVDAKKLSTAYALVETNSKGDCEVNVSEKLEYSIRGVGNIYVYGKPKEIIVKDTASTGRLIQF